MKLPYPNLQSLTMLMLLFAASTVNELAAQQMIKEKPFIVQTPFLEPDGRVLSLKVGDSIIFNLGKSKGGTVGGAEYVLEKRDANLEVKWQATLETGPAENILGLYASESQLYVFSVVHGLKNKSAELKAYHYQIKNGNLNSEKTLLTNEVNPWQEAYGKGAVMLELRDYISSGSSHKELTPLQYQYKLAFSPDNSKIMACFYDHGKATLLMDVAIFDAGLKLIQQGQVPVDRGYLNAGAYVNDRGELFLLNADPEGAMAVIRYNFANKKSQFLQVKTSSSQRAEYHLNFLNDDRVLVRNLAERDGGLAGIMFSTFNFAENQVEDIRYFEIPSLLDSLLQVDLTETGLSNFEQVAYLETKAREKVLILEKRNYLSPGFLYKRNAPADLSLWRRRKAQVEAGDVIMLGFDAALNLKWIQFVPKYQTAIANEGFNSIGVVAAILKDRVDILYAGSTSREKFQYTSFNLNDGQIIKNVELENTENLVLLRPYTHWIGKDILVLVGKRGFSGKSSTIKKYLLN